MTTSTASREAVARRLRDLSPAKRELLLRRLAGRESPEPVIRHEAGADAPLSCAQDRVWLAHHLDESGIAYNVPLSIRLRGPLDDGALVAALARIAERHDVLRTRFPAVDGRPRQVVCGHRQRIERIPLCGTPEANEREAVAIARARAATPFDVQQEALFRAALIRIAGEDHLLHLDLHHLVCDGWSFAVLFRELQALYSAPAAEGAGALTAPRIQFADYARWERDTIAGDRLTHLVDFWRSTLHGAPQVLDLPFCQARPESQSFRGARHGFRIDAAVTRALRRIARQEQVTMFVALVAAFQVLLGRYSGRDDFLIGTDVANGTQPETDGLIGFFVNLIVLRARLDPGMSFRMLLARTREEALDAFAHQEMPFSLLVEALRPSRSPAYTPFVQVLFVLQNTLPPSVALPGLRARLQQPDIGTCRFDVAMGVAETGEGLDGLWNYSTALFDETSIAAMSRDYEVVVKRAAESPDRTLEELTAGCAAVRRRAMTTQGAQSIRDRLRQAQPRPIPVTAAAVVRQRPLTEGQRMPLLIEPAIDGLDAVAWARDSRETIEAALLAHGAILFRGFALPAIADFEHFAEAICPTLFADYGDLPQEPETPKIYRSTPYPAAETIRFHNEGSHTGRWPMRQFFHCVTPAARGGQTPIADCRKMYEHLDPSIVAAFEDQGLLYVRNFTDGLDVNWREFFRTEDKTAVEENCARHGTECEWKPDGLRIRQRCPGTARHPRTGEPIFFNQVQLHHPSCLDREVREWLLASVGEDNLPRNVLFGDGTPIPESTMAAVDEAYWACATEFDWQRHDVLLVDNMLVAHARRPFQGPRKITVAMGEMMTLESLAMV